MIQHNKSRVAFAVACCCCLLLLLLAIANCEIDLLRWRKNMLKALRARKTEDWTLRRRATRTYASY